MSERIEQAITIDKSVGATWDLITDPIALGEWMGGTLEINLKPGGRLIFRTEDRIQRGEITELDPGARLAWTWSDGPEESLVTIEIDGDDNNTTVWVTERLLPPRNWSRPSIPPTQARA